MEHLVNIASDIYNCPLPSSHPSLHNDTMNTPPAPNLHDIAQDPRNSSILISVNGELFPRDKAVVSVFDSGFLLGDGVRALHWDNAAWNSTGFEKTPTSPISLPLPLQRIADEARPYDERLRKHSL